MLNSVLLVLILLQIKHWYIDFVNQSEEEVQYKGTYLDWRGVKHSLKQGVATMFVFFWFIDPISSFILGLIDFILHYHIDFCKIRFGNRDIKTPQFWAQLGLDQMAHQLTYIGLIWLLFI
jgi:Protein of unknown function (DUF3307)